MPTALHARRLCVTKVVRLILLWSIHFFIACSSRHCTGVYIDTTTLKRQTNDEKHILSWSLYFPLFSLSLIDTQFIPVHFGIVGRIKIIFGNGVSYKPTAASVFFFFGENDYRRRVWAHIWKGFAHTIRKHSKVIGATWTFFSLVYIKMCIICTQCACITVLFSSPPTSRSKMGTEWSERGR